MGVIVIFVRRLEDPWEDKMGRTLANNYVGTLCRTVFKKKKNSGNKGTLVYRL